MKQTNNMNHTHQAIRDAVEKGGYDHDAQFLIDILECQHDQSFLLDPAFWKALGVARGYDSNDERHNCDALGCSSVEHVGEDRWQKDWHNFIDHLIEEGYIESFFKSISSNE